MMCRAGLLLAALLCAACARGGEVADLIIRGGIVVDGSGDAPRAGTVVIADGMIVTVGGAAADGGGVEAFDTIDASGLVVAPGFIDVHNHTPPAIVLPGNHLNEGFIRQGVTTVFGGPDGAFAPAHIRRFSELYAEQGIGTNVAFYIGHNGIRNEVMGDDQQRTPTDQELQAPSACRPG